MQDDKLDILVLPSGTIFRSTTMARKTKTTKGSSCEDVESLNMKKVSFCEDLEVKRKTVAFCENVVVIDIPVRAYKNHGILYYTEKDYRRFQLESDLRDLKKKKPVVGYLVNVGYNVRRKLQTPTERRHRTNPCA